MRPRTKPFKAEGSPIPGFSGTSNPTFRRKGWMLSLYSAKSFWIASCGSIPTTWSENKISSISLWIAWICDASVPPEAASRPGSWSTINQAAMPNAFSSGLISGMSFLAMAPSCS